MRPVSGYAAITLLAVMALGAQTPPTWRHATTAPIKLFRVTPLGTVIVGTRDGLVSLEPDSGTVIWTRGDLTDVGPAAYGAIDHSPHAIVVAGERVELIDLVSGATRWTTPVQGRLAPYVSIPEYGLVLASGSTDSLRHVLAAFELPSGSVRWLRAQPFDIRRDASPPPPPIAVSDTTFLLYIPGHGPVLMHAGTGEWLWGTDKLQGWETLPLVGVPVWVRGGGMMLADTIVYASLENRVHALRLHDGAHLWADAPRFPAAVAQFALTGHGLLVRSQALREGQRSALDLVDAATGDVRWRRRFGGLLAGPQPTTSFVADTNRAFIAASGALLAIALEDGTTTELARVKSRGGEHPFLVERRGDALLLIGNQNLILFDSTGATRYHAYHAAPGRSTLEKVGLGTLGVAWNALVVVQSAAALAGGALSGVTLGAVPAPAGGAGGELGFWFPDLGKRYAASEQARNYVYSVAYEADSTGRSRPAFLRLHKDDGRVVGRVWLDERRPRYALDLVGAVLYVQERAEIRAFTF
jgi:outer membrane protein assembly factor BamB